MITVKTTDKKGRGVFATEDIQTDQIFESAEILLLKKEEIEFIEKTIIDEYVFVWGETCALVLGNGMLYNHSYKPNARYVRDFENNKMHYVALRPIKSGEEIRINYNGDPECMDRLWFNVIDWCL